MPKICFKKYKNYILFYLDFRFILFRFPDDIKIIL